ncbi:right-handed parallel beta-helix repeat-containing protein, partial [bacterium]|nr:right-handed parallel beta-helix repeat-containing protein [bacterium]
KISETYESGDYYETLDNGLYAILIDEKLNVKQFGAKGDGTSDDKAIIQTALDYAQGKELYFDDSTYTIDSYLSLTNNIIIGNNTIIKALSTFSSNYMIMPHGAVEIKNIKFDCNNYSICCVGESDDNTKIDIDNCIFTGAKRNTDADNFALNSCLYLCAKDINVTNSKVNNNLSHGLRLLAKVSGTIVNVDNCEFNNNGLIADVDNVQAVGLVSYGSAQGTLFEKVTVTNCYAIGNANTGISPHSCKNSIIANCVSNDNGEHGYCLMNGTNGIISNCIAINNRKYGVRVQGDYNTTGEYTGYKDFVISNNYLEGSGIDLDNHIENGIISDNLIKYKQSWSSETSKGIRIGRQNNVTDIFKNVDIINNRIIGYETDPFISFIELHNDCKIDNIINGKEEKNYKHGYEYFRINTLVDEEYGTSNNVITDYNDFSTWSKGSGITQENNIFAIPDAVSTYVLAFKAISVDSCPRFVSITSNFENLDENNHDLNFSIGLRFRNASNSLIGGDRSYLTYTPNNNMSRTFDLSKIASFPKGDVAKVEVIIKSQGSTSVRIDNCLCSLSNTPPIMPNNL